VEYNPRSMRPTTSAPDVLVVEDDPDLNEVVGAFVELSGYGWRSALNGAAALRELHERPPGLVLLDLMLPDIDGFEVCARLRADVTTRAVPVVVLSAVSDGAARQRATELGVQEYLVKPFDPERLMRVIRETLRAPDAP
jgi:DNA-binding response OmpR family regulator